MPAPAASAGESLGGNSDGPTHRGEGRLCSSCLYHLPAGQAHSCATALLAQLVDAAPARTLLLRRHLDLVGTASGPAAAATGHRGVPAPSCAGTREASLEKPEAPDTPSPSLACPSPHCRGRDVSPRPSGVPQEITTQVPHRQVRAPGHLGSNSQSGRWRGGTGVRSRLRWGVRCWELPAGRSCHLRAPNPRVGDRSSLAALAACGTGSAPSPRRVGRRTCLLLPEGHRRPHELHPARPREPRAQQPLPEGHWCGQSACVSWAGVRLPGTRRAEATHASQWREPSCPKCQELLAEKHFSPQKSVGRTTKASQPALGLITHRDTHTLSGDSAKAACPLL